MDVAVGMPDLWPFVKRVKSTVSFFHSQVRRRAVLKRNSERCQTRDSGRAGWFPGCPSSVQSRRQAFMDCRFAQQF